MRRLTLLGVVALVCGVATAARADTLFNLNATLTQTGVANPGKATLQGTLGFNSATGALTQQMVVFMNPGASGYNGSYTLNLFGGPTTGSTPTEFGFQGYIVPYQAALFLYLPVAAPLIGYNGGPICSTAFACFNSQNGTIRDDSTVAINGGSATLPFVNLS